jgi:hypothetical protein
MIQAPHVNTGVVRKVYSRLISEAPTGIKETALELKTWDSPNGTWQIPAGETGV